MSVRVKTRTRTARLLQVMLAMPGVTSVRGRVTSLDVAQADAGQITTMH